MSTVASTVSMKWIESTLMTGVDSGGRPLTIGYHKGFDDKEWRGLKASDLLLLAAASCSAYDIVTILSKQREPFTGLEVSCTGEQNTEPPYAFISIHLKYRVQGKVSAEKLERAIQLSEDKYCSVLATLRPTVRITNEFEIFE